MINYKSRGRDLVSHTFGLFEIKKWEGLGLAELLQFSFRENNMKELDDERKKEREREMDIISNK